MTWTEIVAFSVVALAVAFGAPVFARWWREAKHTADGERDCARCWDGACTGCRHGKRKGAD